MRQHLLIVTAPVFLLASAGLCTGQDQTNVTAQREAMKKLDYWVGEWKGTGWFQAGPGGKHETAITETIRMKLGGLALLAEGQGRTAGADGAQVTTHDALGIICWDPETRRYRFVYYRAGDKLGEAELKLIEGGLQWERRVDKGTVRFTANIDAERWYEVGEFSADGKTWRKFMEMTLHRQKPGQGGGKP